MGRLTIPLAENADYTIGVDISSGHLREARAACDIFGSTAEFTEIANIADLDHIGTFDFIMSRIVLQHNPPPIMAAIYRRLLRLLEPGGVAVVQIPTYISGYKFSVKEYLSSDVTDMEMNALPQQAIFDIVGEEDCVMCEVIEDAGLGVYDGVSHVFAARRRHHHVAELAKEAA